MFEIFVAIEDLINSAVYNIEWIQAILNELKQKLKLAKVSVVNYNLNKKIHKLTFELSMWNCFAQFDLSAKKDGKTVYFKIAIKKPQL